ncbi:hypothetical protein [Bacillus cereus]|uniref:Uncharacterized protein n=1 Tax=Bacillus cereus TaxID=1396 RepID=A0A2B9E593_BACCE|nr:hypothetical protein [Bacillus cereus]PGM95214.1 hypothetical protein CN958_08310 [Bacillus cereus]
MKKMMRHALLGVTLLTGIAMIGVDSASAEEHPVLKDSNGNSIVYGKEYYMEPYDFSGQGIEIKTWKHNGYRNEETLSSIGPSQRSEFALSTGPGSTVKFQEYSSERLGSGNVSIEVSRQSPGLNYYIGGRDPRSVNQLNSNDWTLSYLLVFAPDQDLRIYNRPDVRDGRAWTPQAPSANADMNSAFADGNYFALKDASNYFNGLNTFMSYGESGDHPLDPEPGTNLLEISYNMDSKAMWRFIPAE